MTDLSPAAQAVMDAYVDANWGAELTSSDRRGLAAALRAAADQVAAWADEDGRVELGDLVEIAAELEP